MLRVAGRPILERLVLHLVGYGVRRIFLAVNYLSKQIEDHFEDGGEFGCRDLDLPAGPFQPARPMPLPLLNHRRRRRVDAGQGGNQPPHQLRIVSEGGDQTGPHRRR